MSIFLRKNTNISRIHHVFDHAHLSHVYQDTLEQYFKQDTPEYVIHTWTCYKKTHISEDLEEMIDANVSFPAKILQLCTDNSVKYFINTGTFFEYSYQDNEVITERLDIWARNLYASTKLAFLEILKYYCEIEWIKSINLRLFSPYGKKDNLKVIPLIIQKLLLGEEIRLINQRLCFTYVEDIVDAYILCIDKIQNMTEQYTDINIAGKSHTISEVVSILENISQKKLTIIWWTYALRSEKNVRCDTSKAYNLLDWNEKTPIDKWLILTYKYYKDEIS